jgi:ketosteroid isomerase-like protein
MGALRILMLFILTLGSVGPIKSPVDTVVKTDAEIEKEVLSVEAERDQAMQKRDMAALDRIYADDIVIVNTRGRVLTKSQRLTDFQSGDLKFLSFGQDDYRFHVYGDTVVMTGRASSVVEYHGKVNSIPRRFTFTYIKLDGHWRLVAQNETLVAEP